MALIGMVAGSRGSTPLCAIILCAIRAITCRRIKSIVGISTGIFSSRQCVSRSFLMGIAFGSLCMSSACVYETYAVISIYYYSQIDSPMYEVCSIALLNYSFHQRLLQDNPLNSGQNCASKFNKFYWVISRQVQLLNRPVSPQQQAICSEQMVLIEYTNIVVDDFSEAKQRPFSHFIHFLTHMHTDHFNGLTDSWNLGVIYCSRITADLLTHKFPKLSSIVHPLQLYQPYEISLSPDESLKVTATLFDANHCAGAVMILFEGYMGTVLHTGDIRFDKEKFRDYSYLYPANQANDRFERCSKHVDVLYLDNTFCDKVFEFPTRDQAMQMLLDFVKKIGKRRFYIGLDNIGKEEMLVELAKQMETLVVVTNTRYQNILHMGFDHHIFTTDVSEGWIEVVPKKQLRALLENDKTAIGIVPTGWCNKAMYQEISRLYFVPYSLHSNYLQLQQFVKSIYPSQIIPIVRSHSKRQLVDTELSEQRENWQQIYTMASMRQSGLSILKQFNSPCSKDYLEIKSNVEVQKSINRRLTLLRTEEEDRSINAARMQDKVNREKEVRRSRKGAKLNVQVDIDEVQKSRLMLQNAVMRKIVEDREKDNHQQQEDIEEQAAEVKQKTMEQEEDDQIQEIEVIQISDDQDQKPLKMQKKHQEVIRIRQISVNNPAPPAPQALPTKKSLSDIKLTLKLTVPQTRQQILDHFFKPRPT